MYRPITHIVVSFLALFLAFSAAYVFSERDEVKTLFYGPSSILTIPPNTNTTIPLAGVFDRREPEKRLTVHFSDAGFGDQSSSIQQPTFYSLGTSLSVAAQVNKSAFMLLEEVDFMSFPLNRTIYAAAFHSSNFPLDKPEVRETATIESGMELNMFYQLKIGNYETFLTNQTGPLHFTIQRTDRSLEVALGTALVPWDPPRYSVAVTFTRQPNLYLVAVLLIVDAALITTYSVMKWKWALGRKIPNTA